MVGVKVKVGAAVFVGRIVAVIVGDGRAVCVGSSVGVKVEEGAAKKANAVGRLNLNGTIEGQRIGIPSTMNTNRIKRKRTSARCRFFSRSFCFLSGETKGISSS